MIAVIAFLVLVAVDLGGLSRPRDEVSLEVGPEALAAGFRDGVEWHGLYRDGTKVGFSRLERERTGSGYRLSQSTRLTTDEGGATSIDVQTELGPGFELVRFEATTDGPVRLEAEGRVEDDVLVVDIDGLPGKAASVEIPLDEPPVFDFSLGPLVMQSDLQPGDRFRFRHFDPTTGSTSESTVEFVGREPVDVLGERVDAYHLLQTVAGQQLHVWVNELGEVLREELPWGLVSVRESEAEATYGVLETKGRS